MAKTKPAAGKRQATKSKTQSRPKAARKPKPSQRVPRGEVSHGGGDAYSRHKERARNRQATLSQEGRDIATDMPQCSDVALRQSVTKSLKLFCEKCLGERFTMGWSEDHLTAIKKMERAIFDGANFAIAMPRGSGKTTLVIAAVIWAILCGHKRYVALIGADRDAAQKLLQGVKVELETNEILLALFPEAVYPIIRLEGIANRCRGQLYEGQRTYIGWTAKQIQFATIPKRGEPGERTASGAIIETAGIKGKVRGMQTALPTGEIARPDMFIVDDPQTDASAHSRTQVKSRLDVITGTCPGLAGPGKQISGFVTCTVIAEDDVADQLLNPQKFPDYQGERFQLVYEWPEDSDLWEHYSTIYRESMARGEGMKRCNAYVMANWDRMHYGSKVAWEERKRKDEVSPLQHAYNLSIRLGDTFWSEYQNKPRSYDDAEDLLSVDEIQKRTNGFKRRQVPHAANLLTAFIDVQGECLYWIVVAFCKETFSSWVIDYGAWPEQASNYFTKRTLSRKLSVKYKGGREAYIRKGILELLDHLCEHDWVMADQSTTLRISQVGIDAAWGPATRVIQSAVMESKHRAIVLPTFGRCLEAKDLPMDLWKPKPGERLGIGYSIRPRQGGGQYGLLDANYWKSFVHARLATEIGDAGSLSLFDPDGMVTTHRMIAEHLRSEKRSEDAKGSRVLHMWTHENKNADNDLLDALAGACAMAGIQGARLADVNIARRRRKVRKRTTIKA
jgi:hypothetical protein